MALNDIIVPMENSSGRFDELVLPDATTSARGLLSSTDKTKLDDLQYEGLAFGLYDGANDAAGATVSDGDLNIIGAHTSTFSAQNLTANRSYTLPDASGRLQLEGQPIGNTTPAAGSFTTLAANNTTTLTGQIRLSIGGANVALRRGDGITFFLGNYNTFFECNAREFRLGHGGTGGPVSFFLDGNGTIEQRNAANAQTFRLYNSFSSATNFERFAVRWASNELIIDAQAGSVGGSLRGIKLGSASTSLLGFFGATPVVQGAAVADATDAASTQEYLNELLARVRTLGLIAT